MSVCTFFGHRDCYGLDESLLQSKIEELIRQGVDTFYLGNQGQFDRMVFGCLGRLVQVYPHIDFAVVLAYFPTQDAETDPYCGRSIYPEGMEEGPPRFAIERRNRWMVNHSDYCLCYITHTQGGAFKFAKYAKQKGLTIIHLGNALL